MWSLQNLVLLLALSGACGERCLGGFNQDAASYASANYKVQNRRGKITRDVTQAEVTWQPQDMLADITCHNLEETVLLMREAKGGDYRVVDATMRSGAKWYVKVKPCLVYEFAIKVIGEAEDVVELADTLGPATPEEIKESGFTPNAPTGFAPEVLSGNATLKWKPSDCAEGYDIYYNEVGSDKQATYVPWTGGEATSVGIDSLKPCTDYEVTLVAYLGNQESETFENFATKPRFDAVRDMEIKVEPSMDQVVITLTVSGASCINEYEMTVCPKDRDCEQPTTIAKKPTGLYIVTERAQGLSPCTDYSVEVQPLYPDFELESKTVDFRTLSPDASTVQIPPPLVFDEGSGSVKVEWQGVECASRYRVYQKESNDYKSTWRKVNETTKVDHTVSNLTPCINYDFAVAAVLDGQESEKFAGPPVEPKLNEADPFDAPGLQVWNADRHADISWLHAECISSYLVKACSEGGQDCIEKMVEPNDGERNVTHRIEELQPCTQYSLEVIPVNPGKTFTARVNDFTTTNGTPEAPANFVVALAAEDGSTSAKLKWNPVQCSTGYRVFYESDDGGKEENVTTKGLLKEFEGLSPCTTYYYAVATLVGGEESDPTERQSLETPPDVSLPPKLQILSNENDKVTLRLELPKINSRCAIKEYSLSYSADGAEPYQKKAILPDEANEDLFLEFTGASSPNVIIQAQARYINGDVKSEIASTREPGYHSKVSSIEPPGDAASTLLPIVIGTLVGVVLLALLVVFLVRRRRGRDAAYDTEKTAKNENGKKEETQKLNEAVDHPEV